MTSQAAYLAQTMPGMTACIFIPPAKAESLHSNGINPELLFPQAVPHQKLIAKLISSFLLAPQQTVQLQSPKHSLERGNLLEKGWKSPHQQQNASEKHSTGLSFFFGMKTRTGIFTWFGKIISLFPIKGCTPCSSSSQLHQNLLSSLQIKDS